MKTQITFWKFNSTFFWAFFGDFLLHFVTFLFYGFHIFFNNFIRQTYSTVPIDSFRIRWRFLALFCFTLLHFVALLRNPMKMTFEIKYIFCITVFFSQKSKRRAFWSPGWKKGVKIETFFGFSEMDILKMSKIENPNYFLKIRFYFSKNKNKKRERTGTLKTGYILRRISVPGLLC